MVSFARTTTVRKFNVRDNRKHFGAVVRIVAALPMGWLRLRLLARILLARLDRCAGAGQWVSDSPYCHPTVAGAAQSAGLAPLSMAPTRRSLKLCPVTLPRPF